MRHVFIISKIIYYECLLIKSKKIVSPKKKQEADDISLKHRWLCTSRKYNCSIWIPANIPAEAESQLHSLEQAARRNDIHVNANKIEFMGFEQDGAISTLSRRPVHIPQQQYLIYWKRCHYTYR